MQNVDFLLINPWIYDFSAHDLWLKPYGLLQLAGRLRGAGYSIHYLDLLDPFHPELPVLPRRKSYGTGSFYREIVPKPAFFQDVPRRFYRYGMPFELFLKELASIRFKAVMLTCTMTYWYSGLFALIDFFARKYPQTPIYIGGIYARLCGEHLSDFIQNHFPWLDFEIVNGEPNEFIKRLQGRYPPSGVPHGRAYPVFDLQRRIPYVVLLTSEGCPFNCPYCASRRLYPAFKQKNPQTVVEEIVYWHKNYDISDFAFYDDALLVNFDHHLAVILEEICRMGLKVRFHTPNAMHARFIGRESALLLKQAGFTTIRLGLERIEERFDSKVTAEEFRGAIEHLKNAGFTSKELGAYVLYGVPDESFDAIKRTIVFLDTLGVMPYLAEFSPIPHTSFFKLAQESSRYPIGDEPLCQNNTVFPALKNPPWATIQEIKDLARNIRMKLISVP